MHTVFTDCQVGGGGGCDGGASAGASALNAGDGGAVSQPLTPTEDIPASLPSSLSLPSTFAQHDVPSEAAVAAPCATTSNGEAGAAPLEVNVQLNISDAFEQTDPEVVRSSSSRILRAFIVISLDKAAESSEDVHISAHASVRAEASVSSVNGACGDTSSSDEDRDSGTLSPVPLNQAQTRQLRESAFGNLNDVERQIASRLAELGDLVQNQCGAEIEQLIDQLGNIESFNSVLGRIAKMVFTNNSINWGRIVVLFYFGFRIFLRYVGQGVREAIIAVFNKVVAALNEICSARIFRWIANHGGWLRVTEMRRRSRTTVATSTSTDLISSSSSSLLGIFSSLSLVEQTTVVAAIVVVIAFFRYRQLQ
uniref:BCL domain-containing protein n=1 Tax=Mesocestoides corti TaxID=53468 RepID=A0A5K3FJ88_MESCO